MNKLAIGLFVAGLVFCLGARFCSVGRAMLALMGFIFIAGSVASMIHGDLDDDEEMPN